MGLLASSAPVSGQSAGGTVSGIVTNGTLGGNSSVSDLEVRLETYVNFQLTTNLTATTGTDGSFKFDNLATDLQNSYRIIVNFQEGDHFGDYLTFAPGESSKSVNITVYESTDDANVITDSSAHVIIVPAKNELEITVVYEFTNSSDRTFIGTGEPMANGKKKTLAFTLPAEATDVRYGVGFDQQYIYPSHYGFIDTVPVPPGTKEVAFIYKVPLTGGSYNFREKLNYSVSWFNLLVQGEGIKVKSAQLTEQDKLIFGEGNSYLYFTGLNFARGETISADISGLAGASNQLLLLVLGGAGVVIIIGGGFAFLRKRPGKKEQPAQQVIDSDNTEASLLQELARLDDSFADGLLSEEDYRKQRAQKKAILVKLMNGKRGL